MRWEFARLFGQAIAASVAIAIVQLAPTPVAGGATAAQNWDRVANPVLPRRMPPAGWIAAHRDKWVAEHPAYAATCQTAEVVQEIRFLDRLIGYDEYVVNVSDPGAPQAAPHSKPGEGLSDQLQADLLVADNLAALLKMLPTCKETAAAGPLMAGRPMVPADAPSPAAIPGPAAPPPERTVPTPMAPRAATTPPPRSGRMLIRFDDHVPALTPSGIRVFTAAVDALRSGRKVTLAIDGCGAGADFSNGSPCARRLASLKELLADNGVRNPQGLFAELR